MSNEHDPVTETYASQAPYCRKCGVMVGTYDYTQPCTGTPETVAVGFAEGWNSVDTDVESQNPIEAALKESAFDRMDRMYKNK